MSGTDPSASYLSALMAEAKWERRSAPPSTPPSDSDGSDSVPAIPPELYELFGELSDFVDVPDPDRMSGDFKEIVYHWGWTMLQASAFEHLVRLTAHDSVDPGKNGEGTKRAKAYPPDTEGRGANLKDLIRCLRIDDSDAVQSLQETVDLRNRVAHSELDFDRWVGIAQSERYREFVHQGPVLRPWFEGGVSDLEALAVQFRDAMQIVVTEATPIFGRSAE